MKKKKDGIDEKQLAICKQRGHHTRYLGDEWSQCKWCGMWLREVRKIEERRDAPPADQQSSVQKLMDEAEKKRK